MNKIPFRKNSSIFSNSNKENNLTFSWNNYTRLFLAITMFFVLVIVTQTLNQLSQFFKIHYYETASLTSLNLTLLALVFSLEVLPSFIKEDKYSELSITARLDQEKKDELVNNTSFVLTLICIGITGIHLVKFFHFEKLNKNCLSLLDEKTITNLFVFFLCVYFISLFPHLDQIRVHPFINNLRSLKRFDDYKTPKQITRFLGDCILFLTPIIAIINPSSPGNISGEQLLISMVIIILVFFDCCSRSLNIKYKSCTKWMTLAILLASFFLISFGIYLDLRHAATPLSFSLSLSFIMFLCLLLPFGFGSKSDLGVRFIKYCCFNLRRSTEAELSRQKEELENLDNELKLRINKEIWSNLPQYNKYELEVRSSSASCMANRKANLQRFSPIRILGRLFDFIR